MGHASRVFSSLPIDRFAAPISRVNVANRLGKGPAVPREIHCIVLAFAVPMVRGFRPDLSAGLAGSLAMAPGIAHAKHDVGRLLSGEFPFGDDQTAVAEFQLDSMVDCGAERTEETLSRTSTCKAGKRIALD